MALTLQEKKSRIPLGKKSLYIDGGPDYEGREERQLVGKEELEVAWSENRLRETKGRRKEVRLGACRRWREEEIIYEGRVEWRENALFLS